MYVGSVRACNSSHFDYAPAAGLHKIDALTDALCGVWESIMSYRRWRQQAFLLSWVGLCICGAARSEQPLAKPTPEQQISDALRDMHNKAADLFNVNKDYAGAYRMFQGGLYVARPLLQSRPDVQQLLDQGLQEAERTASMPERAMRLHRTIEEMRSKLRPTAEQKPADSKPPAAPAPAPPLNPTAPLTNPFPPPSNPPATQALWKRLGNEEGVKKIVDKFTTLVILDPKIDFTRGDRFKFDAKGEEALKTKLVAYISSISDGTIPYTGRSMAEAHKGMAITAEQFDALVGSLRLAMRQNNVFESDIDELMKKIEATRADIVGK